MPDLLSQLRANIARVSEHEFMKQLPTVSVEHRSGDEISTSIFFRFKANARRQVKTYYTLYKVANSR